MLFEMSIEQGFVGGVAVLLGLWALIAAVLNHEASFQLSKAKWLQACFGRGMTRGIYLVIGVLLIALGVYIAVWQPHRQPTGGRPTVGAERVALPDRKGFGSNVNSPLSLA
jgi:hypothetical protein